MRMKLLNRNECIRSFPVLLLFGCLLTSSCQVTVKDLSSSERYKNFIGRQYKLLVDCYVFQFVGDERQDLYIGAVGDLPLQSEIGQESSVSAKRSLVGKKSGACKVVGFIAKGSRIKITRIEKHTSTDHVQYHFYIEFLDAQYAKYGVVDALWLVAKQYPPDGFDEKMVEVIDLKDEGKK